MLPPRQPLTLQHSWAMGFPLPGPGDEALSDAIMGVFNYKLWEPLPRTPNPSQPLLCSNAILLDLLGLRSPKGLAKREKAQIGPAGNTTGESAGL